MHFLTITCILSDIFPLLHENHFILHYVARVTFDFQTSHLLGVNSACCQPCILMLPYLLIIIKALLHVHCFVKCDDAPV